MLLSIPGASVTELHVGLTKKEFFVHTDRLTRSSSFFRSVLDSPPKDAKTAPLAFPELDEFAFALFVRWLYGTTLNGPNNYHTTQHYLDLYILGYQFKIERLCNEVMDMVRAYYRTSNTTPGLDRVRHLSAGTDQACAMRRFLVSAAAYRAMCEGGPGEKTKEAVRSDPTLAVDFYTALIDCHKNDLADPRRGEDCVWHAHDHSKKCKKLSAEPWQNV
jgi:hypothetical protein